MKKKYYQLTIVLLLLIPLAGAVRKAAEFTTTGTVSKVDSIRQVPGMNSFDNAYMIIHSETQNKTWDTSLNSGAGGFADITAVTHANAAIPLTDYRAHAIDAWYMVFPAALATQDGGVSIKYYDNAVPAASDIHKFGRYGNMRSGQLQSLNDL